MKTQIMLVLLAIHLYALTASCSDVWYQHNGRSYEKRVPITVTNPLQVDRVQEPVIVNLADLAAKAPDFPGKSWVVVDSDAKPESPCNLESNGNDAPSQMDDLDGDGKPDQLVFLATLAPGQKKTFHVYYTEKNIPPFLYPRRTQITTFHEADTNTLFAIESDLSMFRVNPVNKESSPFVWDIFGKYKEYPGYIQHLYNKTIPIMNQAGSFLTDSPQGRCILHPWDRLGQIGIGSVLYNKGDTLAWLEGPEMETSAKILVDGRIRSVGEVTMRNCQADENIYDVKARFSMFAGQPYLQYDLEIIRRGGGGPSPAFCLGMMKLDNETKDAQPDQGCLLSWGDRKKISVKDIGMGILFSPGSVLKVEETPQGYGLALKVGNGANPALKERFHLVGTWKEGGYFNDAPTFFASQKQLAQKLQHPLQIEVGKSELSSPRQEKTTAFTKAEFFLSNPSNKRSVLPAEIDPVLYGYELKGGANVRAEGDGTLAEVATVDGKPRIFVQKAVDPLKTEKISIQATETKPKPSFRIEEGDVDGDGVSDLWVSTGKVRWLVTGKGLHKVEMGGKTLELEPSSTNGPIRLLHNGNVVAIVRVGEKSAFTDYCFYKDCPIARMVTSGPFHLTGKEARSYVAKKEVGAAACEQIDVNPWGRITSDTVFFPSHKTILRSPSEWGLLYAPTGKMGLVISGSPSAERIEVNKGGIFHSALADGRQTQEIFLAAVEKPEDGEVMFPLLTPPITFLAKGNGFQSFENRNGNSVPDVVHVEDRNGNGQPDFDGDKWSFDLDADDVLQMVMEFEQMPEEGGKTHRAMKVYCDTISGSAIHGNQLGAYFGDFPFYDGLPCGNIYLSRYPKERNKYDGCLGPGELMRPFHTFEDCSRDGLVFQGPVTAGGFIAGDRVVSQRNGPYFYNSLVRNCALECFDLDGDGDNDIWSIESPDSFGAIPTKELRTDKRFVGFICFDLSDNNLDPVAVVNPWSGQTFWAVRYYSMVQADNTKYYQQGHYNDKGTIVGGQNWPEVGTWDIDKDGIAEGHIFVETQLTLGLDLLNKHRLTPEESMRDRLQFQRDIYWDKALHSPNFGILAEYIDKRKLGQLIGFIVDTYPAPTYTDPQGRKISLCGPYLPEQWHGERLECKVWPDGQYDYIPTSNWNSFLKKYPFVEIHHWQPGQYRLCHEGVWDHMYFNPVSRCEIDSDGNSSFRLYLSPIMGGLHYQGLKFGLQYFDKRGTKAQWDKCAYQYYQKRPFPQHVAEYCRPRMLCNDAPQEARLLGNMYLYYRDRNGDGYTDTYLLDDENDGYFEKRLWYDKASALLTLYDGGAVASFVKPLEFPGHRIELKNYDALVDLYREGLKRPGLLKELKIETGQCKGADAKAVFHFGKEWVPQIVADASHLKDEADPWKDFNSSGLDTFGRVVSESPVTMTALEKKWSREALQPVDVFIIFRAVTMPGEAELAALKNYVTDGGTAVLMVGMEEANELAASRLVARLFGVEIGDKMALTVLPDAKAPERPEKGAPGFQSGGFLDGVAPIFLEAREMTLPKEVRVILEYQKTPVIAEVMAGKGRFVVVAANVFENKFMCLPFEKRVILYQPGNQDVAAKFIQSLLGDRELRLSDSVSGKNEAAIRIRGKGGPVTIETQWPEVAVEVNGKKEQVEKTGTGFMIQVPGGDARLKIQKREQ